MTDFVEPIRNMRSRQVNQTLHGRSVFRRQDVPGHNVFKGYSTPGVGDAVDLFAPAGEEVYAVAGGVQIRHQGDESRKEVIYLLGEGWLGVYAHIDARHSGNNAKFAIGDVVGTLRGELLQPHLHFELWLGGKAVSAPTPGGLRSLMLSRLGLSASGQVYVPGDPRLIVAKPAGSEPSLDGLLYNELPSRWNHNQGTIEADTQALGEWLGKDATGLPPFEHIRQALDQMHVDYTIDTKHLHSTTDPRVYVFTT